MKLNKNLFTEKVEKKSTRQGYSEGLCDLGSDKRVYALTADLAGSVGMGAFEKAFKERYIDVGVAEQNLVTVAAGLAHIGKIPFASSFAAFSPGRNWEQIRTTICYNDVPVKIASTHTGLGVGEDGATHQMLEDVALMRSLPNIDIVVPCDSIEAEKATVAVSKTGKPAYLRLGRQKLPIITTKATPFKIGKALVFKEGKHVTIIASGPTVYEAMKAAKELDEQKIKAEVINLHTIKPLDKETLLKSAKKTKHVLTVEDHQIMGGMGSAVAEMFSENYPVKMKMLGVHNSFGESGSLEQLYDKYGISSKSIKKEVLKMIK